MIRGTRKSVTLKDIAKETGFSITTVSHALRDLSDISEATKNIVRERAQALGYIGNASAGTLRSGRSKTVAVLLGDMSNPYFAYMSRELETQLRQYGYSAFFMNTNENEEMERNAIILALSNQVAGIISCPVQSTGRSENIRFIQSTHTPCILIGRHFSDLNASFVACDDRMGGLLAGRHILERGHRRILYVDTPYQNSSAIERREGFLQALQESPDSIRFNIVRFDEKGEYMTAIASNSAAPFTAAIAYNDMIAWDLLCRVYDYHLKVPRDLSVMGFDNLHSCFPLPFALTSVSSSKILMARKAVELLMAQIQDPNVGVSSITLDVKLIDRESVLNLNESSGL